MSKACLKSRSEFLRVRDLRHHVRRWGDADGAKLVLLHGWLDVSASFQELVAALIGGQTQSWQVLAPDLRGFGYTEWPQEGYWFQDYLGDLDGLLDHYVPNEPVVLVGHSMGAQIASLYAGLRPERVSRLILLDPPALPDMAPERAPKRYRSWLDHLRAPPSPNTYGSYDDLAQRIRYQHAKLGPEQAQFIAHCWGRIDGDGTVSLRADPRHWQRGPALYRSAESEAIWREIIAPTLFLDGEHSKIGDAVSAGERARRRACFRNRREVVVPDAGHMLHFDAPLATAAAITAFLNR
ncbi:MAG: alpha/beta hydrolase [Nevskia sp.]|jgi:pimeloyl-ACP methyl ester carboxylesterase|nr:alpha/beta hydrolase [Nevskia sp.]